MRGEGSVRAESQATPPDRERKASRQLTIFSFLLAAGALFHQARLEDLSSVFPDVVIALAAVALLVRPSSTACLLFLLAMETVAVAIDLPAVPNHALFVAIIAVGVLVALGAAALRRRPWTASRGALFLRLAPVVRLEVVLLYLFAGFAKLNGSFVDPALSCGAAMTEDLLSPLDLYAAWLGPPAIAGSVLVEFSLPLLLAFRRTRLVGVVVGVGFHTVLALAGHVPFSGFAMAFYFLFLPDDIPARLDRLCARTPALGRAAAGIRRLSASRVALVVVAAAGLVVATALVLRSAGTPPILQRGANVLFPVYVASLVAVFGGALLVGGRAAYRPGALRIAHPVWLLGPVLVVANGISPYVGLKTQSAWTMYSNLQTEEGNWNHLIVPEALRVFGYQDGLVRVVASDAQPLAEAAREEVRLTWADFRASTSTHPTSTVTYERDGRRTVADPIGTNPMLSRPASALETRLLAFRDVPAPERNACRSRRAYSPDQGS